MFDYIESLLQYGLKTGLINEEEKVYSRNLILNYSCTSETASANGCALSDSCKVDNLHSSPPGKGYTTPLFFQFFFERGFEAVKVHGVTVIRVAD